MNPRLLDETDMYVLFQEFDNVFLFEKDSNSEIWRTSMYEGATCGLIGLTNEWALIGGDEFIIWKNDRLKSVTDPDLRWIHDFKRIGETEVSILTDPWKEDSALWQFDVYTEEKIKIRDFPDYQLKAYTKDVEW